MINLKIEEAEQLLAFIKAGTYPTVNADNVTGAVVFLANKIEEANKSKDETELAGE